MSGFANTVFTLLIGWFQTVVSLIWSGLTDKNNENVFTWIGNHWIVIVIVLCAVGIIVDFSVYIARWKPFDVIRSYFDRKKNRSPASQDATVQLPDRSISGPERNRRSETAYSPDEYRPLFASNQSYQDISKESFPEEKYDQDSVSGSAEPILQNRAESRNATEKHEIPADSPYRRPAEQTSVPERETEGVTDASDKVPEPVIRPRRRRINVSELFGNPEEEMIRFTPPKPVIDQTEAYHTPVYPRNWKENGDSANESGTR